MAGPKDSSLEVRTRASLTATENKTITIAGGNVAKTPLSLHVVFPTAPTGTTPDLDISVECVSTNKALRTITVDTIDELSVYPLHIVIPLPVIDGPLFEVDFTVGAGSPTWLNVEAWIELAGAETETNVDASA